MANMSEHLLLELLPKTIKTAVLFTELVHRFSSFQNAVSVAVMLYRFESFSVPFRCAGTVPIVLCRFNSCSVYCIIVLMLDIPCWFPLCCTVSFFFRYSISIVIRCTVSVLLYFFIWVKVWRTASKSWIQGRLLHIFNSLCVFWDQQLFSSSICTPKPYNNQHLSLGAYAPNT